jgi:hypothetical protein
MFDSLPSYISSTASLFTILFCGLTAAVISYFFYNRTIPPLPLAWQLTLATFRGVSVATILFLLFAPEMTLIWQRKTPVHVALAIDRSGSMNLEDRLTEANKAGIRLQDEIASRANLKLYLFDNDTTTFNDFPVTAGDNGTDIGAALTQIGESQFDPQIILMISDGNFTSGTNPVYSLSAKKAKVYTIGVGDTAITPDLIVSNVRTNKIVYQNQPTMIQAEIQLRGKQNVSTNVVLKNEDKTVAVQRVNIEQADVVYPLQFEIIPTQRGSISYQIEAEPFADEQINANNSFSFSLQVLKGKLAIGIVADEPDLDLKFLSFLFEKHKDFDPQILITNRNYSRLSPENSLNADSLDLLVLFNVPPGDVRSRLTNLFTQKKLPLMIFLNKRPESTAFRFLASVSPLQSIQPGAAEKEYEVNRTVQGRVWPVMNIYSDESANDYFWTRCPPISYPFSDLTYGKGTTRLLQSDSNPPEPVMVRFNKGGRRGMIFTGRGFWRWHFLLAEDRQFSNGWANIINNSVRWLTSGSSFGNVILSTDKNNYESGESIRFNVQVYDGSLNPVSDANVILQITGQDQRFEVEADYIEGSNYNGLIPSLGKGSYTFEAQAWRNDVQIGTTKKQLIITPVNSEYISTQQDYQFLQNLAQATGGKYVPVDSVENLLSAIDLSPKIVRTEKSFELWQRNTILFLLIFFLVFEWFIRKRKGLA